MSGTTGIALAEILGFTHGAHEHTCRYPTYIRKFFFFFFFLIMININLVQFYGEKIIVVSPVRNILYNFPPAELDAHF